MNRLTIITLILTFASCKQNSSTKPLLTQKVKYSAFHWHYNEHTNTRDFYLNHYIEIDKKGKYVVMRHDDENISVPEYFSGTINEKILHLIDSVFIGNKYKSEYISDDGNPVIYDGPTYCFDYKNDVGETSRIQFIPPYGPDRLNTLGLLLNTLINNATEPRIDSLPLDDYIKTLKEISFSNLIPLPQKPPPFNKNDPKFEPSKYNK